MKERIGETVINKEWHGYHASKYDRVLDYVNEVTFGDWAHHHWLGFTYGVTIVAADMGASGASLTTLFAGFLADDVKKGVKELLGEDRMRADLMQVRKVLDEMLGYEKLEAKEIEKALCEAWEIEYIDDDDC